MANIPPGDVVTQPSHKIFFNAPFNVKHTCYIHIYNASGRRIGWTTKTTNAQRLGVDPPNGVLDPKESVQIALSCNPIESEKKQTQISNDRITVEWTNTPEGANKQFRREWFQGDGMVRHKNLSIEYNF